MKEKFTSIIDKIKSLPALIFRREKETQKIQKKLSKKEQAKLKAKLKQEKKKKNREIRRIQKLNTHKDTKPQKNSLPQSHKVKRSPFLKGDVATGHLRKEKGFSFSLQKVISRWKIFNNKGKKKIGNNKSKIKNVKQVKKQEVKNLSGVNNIKINNKTPKVFLKRKLVLSLIGLFKRRRIVTGSEISKIESKEQGSEFPIANALGMTTGVDDNKIKEKRRRRFFVFTQNDRKKETEMDSRLLVAEWLRGNDTKETGDSHAREIATPPLAMTTEGDDNKTKAKEENRIRKILLRLLSKKEIRQQEIKPRTRLQKIFGVYKIVMTVYVIFFIMFIAVSKAVQIINFSGTDNVVFQDSSFQNKNLRLYINEDRNSYKFGANKNIEGVNYPEIKSSNINLVWRPKEYPLGKNILLSAEMQDTGDWDYSVVCNSCSPQNKYNWQPFYRGTLGNYYPVKNINGVNIYSKENISNPKDAKTIQDFISQNKDNSSVAVLDNSYSLSNFVNPNIDYKDGSSTTINTTFRGPHQFYVYLKDKLDLSFLKQDLNWYENSDEVTVTLYDMDNNVVFQSRIDDDGNTTNNNITGDINKKFNFPVIPYAGVYRLALSGNNDWLIKNMTINTNKIVFNQSILSLDPANIYTEIKKPKDLTFYAWQPGGIQTIQINSESTSAQIFINDANLGKNQVTNLSPEKYTFATRGNQQISGNYFALNKESYFDPFSQDFTVAVKDSPDFILSTLNMKKDRDWLATNVSVDKKDLLKLDNLNEIPIVLRNAKLDARYTKEKSLQDQEYTQIATFNSYKIWSKGSLKVSSVDATDITDYIKKNIPEKSSIYIESPENISQSNFITTKDPDGYAMAPDYNTNLNFNLRGSHSFYVFAEGTLKVEITKEDLNLYDGSDVVDFNVIDTAGNKVCQGEIDDDGITKVSKIKKQTTKAFECPNLTKGVYIVNLKERVGEGQIARSDFAFRRMRLNTNKVMAKDSVLTLDTTVLYTNNYVDQDISFYYWHEGADQDIYRKNNAGIETIKLKTSDIAKERKYLLKLGQNEIAITKGDLYIYGESFAFNMNNYFNIHSLKVLKNSNSVDIKVAYNQYSSRSYIDSITIKE